MRGGFFFRGIVLESAFSLEGAQAGDVPLPMNRIAEHNVSQNGDEYENHDPPSTDKERR